MSQQRKDANWLDLTSLRRGAREALAGACLLVLVDTGDRHAEELTETEHQLVRQALSRMGLRARPTSQEVTNGLHYLIRRYPRHARGLQQLLATSPRGSQSLGATAARLRRASRHIGPATWTLAPLPDETSAAM